MSKEASQRGAHSLDDAFSDFLQAYPREIVYPIFGLLKCVALCFPVVESQDAINAFVWIVGRHQTETVVKEQASIAQRSRSPERLKLPVIRALRQTRDFYFEDVHQNLDDHVVQRIPRWGKEVQTLPVYSKLNTPHPVMLAWEYESLLGLCTLVEEEQGFCGWAEFAKQYGDKDALLPFPLWPDGTVVGIIGQLPENATPNQVALALLSVRTRRSIEHLRDLIYEGNRFFSQEVSTMLRDRWKTRYADKEKLLFDSIEIKAWDAHIESFQIEDLLPFGLTIEQVYDFLRKSTKK